MIRLAFLLVLFVNGTVASTLTLTDQNDESATVTMAQFEALPTKTMNTWLPWHEESKVYQGVSLKDLFDSVGIQEIENLTLVARNGYHISVDYRILQIHEALLVNKVNQDYLPEKKAPYWLILNVAKYPITTNQYFRNQMIWQVREIKVNH